MPRIFISYKRVDKERVFPIIEEIEHETGVDCWIDLEGIESGDQFQNVIIDAIDHADVVICMISKNFIAPYIDERTGKVDTHKQTFPEKEVMYALRENKRVVPISLDGTTVNDCKWLKFNCAGIDSIDWNKEEQKSKLLKNIIQWSESGSKWPDYIPPVLPRRTTSTTVGAWLKQYWWHTCAAISITALLASMIYTLLSPNRLYFNVEGFPEDSIPLISNQVRSNAQNLTDSANVKIRRIMSQDVNFSNLDVEDREKKLDSLMAAIPLNTFCYATYTNSNGAIRWLRNILGKEDVDIELRRTEGLISVNILSKEDPITHRTENLEKAVAFVARLYSPVTSILYDYIPPQNDYNNSNAWSGTLYTDSEREEMINKLKSDEHESFYYQFIKDNIKNNPSVNTSILPQKVLKLNPDISPNCKQLLVVHNMQIIKSVYKASFCYYEKQGDTWNMIEAPFEVNLGEKGIADFDQKREGDKMVPSGCYTIHEAFGYDDEVKTKLDYKVVNDSHIWISDPNDQKYNMMVEDNDGNYIGISPADTYEILRRKKNGELDNIYKYVIVIDYNCNPVVKGNGSAIFIHIERSPYSSTAGCISMPEDKIIALMQWLDKSKQPYIFITKESIK